MNYTSVHRLLRLLVVLSSVSLSLLLLVYVTKYTYPFLIALMLAFLFNPIVNWLERKWHVTRAVATVLVLLMLLLVIFGIITILIVELINGTSYLADRIPGHFINLIAFFEIFVSEQIIPQYEKLLSLLSILEPSQQSVIINQIEKLGEIIASSGANVLHNTLKNIPVLLGNLPSYITVFIFSLMGTFFISKDWYKLKEYFTNLAPSWLNESTKNVVYGLKKAFFGFLKAQITLISITAIIVLIGLFLLGVDYAITIAIIIGVVDLLPYLGTGLIFVPWILYMFFTNDYSFCIGLSILYMVVIIQRQIMEPKILSTNIGINPLATLIALFAGYQLWGFTGLIFGPILLVIINTLYHTGILTQLWLYIKGN
ncbi:sporulation integral membrane protein YtvI [Radiobacillus sp. PE A8.2]|uniref:sporulation integral membrane protein YtvI n=1 Tax=Radiobacillus sp. PE A8.2 TaxID=3380349 RepID=UPI00388FAC12